MSYAAERNTYDRRHTMMDTVQDNQTTTVIREYGELWNFNLQKIEDIHSAIEKSIHDLENKYVDFESAYGEISSQLDLLSSIYSGYNTISGAESVMRLRALLASYRKRYTRESLDFNLVYNLLIKIAELRNASFEYFPSLAHDGKQTAGTHPAAASRGRAAGRYRWITFERNRSWFIAPFTAITVHTSKQFLVGAVEEPDIINIVVGAETVRVRDIFIKSLDHPVSPRYVILTGRASANYAADAIEKSIYAAHDFITPMLRPFTSIRRNALSPGRVRMFGRNHILLY